MFHREERKAREEFNWTYAKLEFNPPILANPFKIREDIVPVGYWRRLADKKAILHKSY